MKKNLRAAFCACMASALLFSSSFAQNSAAPTSFNQEHWTRPVPGPNASETPTASVSSKALRSFQRSFKNVTAEWYTLGRNYLAKFSMEGKPARAVFGKNGFLLYAICNGSEKDLPADVRRAIKSSYVDYAITSVTEAHSKGATGWIVNLQDDKSLVIVKVVDREMEELEHYQKSGTAQ